jgi:nitrilase
MKVAAIQMCSSDNVDDNLTSAAVLVKQAASQGAQLIVLPEMFALMTPSTTLKLALKEPLGQGKIQQFLAEQAKALHVWIVGGTTPIAGNNPDKARASCLVYNTKGELAARYDKMHLFDVTLSNTETYNESDTIEMGDEVTVVATPAGKLGLAVCYDIRFPELFHAMVKQGADIFAIPAAFTQKTGEAHWEVLIRSTAIQNFSYIIAATQGGTHKSGRQTFGQALIVDPWGKILAQSEGLQPQVIYAEVDLAYLQQVRKSIPVQQHRRLL